MGLHALHDAGSPRQEPEVARHGGLGAVERLLGLVRDLVARREEHGGVVREALADGLDGSRSEEARPERLDLGADPRHLGLAPRVDLLGREVERRVDADHLPVGRGVDLAKARLLRGTCPREKLAAEEVAVALEGRLHARADRLLELPADRGRLHVRDERPLRGGPGEEVVELGEGLGDRVPDGEAPACRPAAEVRADLVEPGPDGAPAEHDVARVLGRRHGLQLGEVEELDLRPVERVHAPLLEGARELVEVVPQLELEERARDARRFARDACAEVLEPRHLTGLT